MNPITASRLTRIRFALPVALLFVLLFVLAGVGHAHPGHGAETGAIGWGLAHPFTGMDHLLAALAVGVLAAVWRRPSVAAAFLAVGVLGGFAGDKIGAFIGLEAMLALSVLVFGLALAFHRHVTQSVVLAMVAIGAAAHGWAHGSEAAGAMGLAGILIGTVAIVALGAVATFAIRRMPRAVAGLGAGIATAAFAILAGRL